VPNEDNQVDKVVRALRERAKELTCLYQIEEILRDFDAKLPATFERIIEAIPPGWQYPEICQVKLLYYQRTYSSPDYQTTKWTLSAPIETADNPIGSLEVSYSEARPLEDEGPFLKEERKLIDTIADRIGHFLAYRRLRTAYSGIKPSSESAEGGSKEQSRSVVDLLFHTDSRLFERIARRMLNHLYTSGIVESESVLRQLGTVSASAVSDACAGALVSAPASTEATFSIGMPSSLPSCEQLRWISHLGHAVKSTSAPVAFASERRFSWSAAVPELQFTHEEEPQQSAMSPWRIISLTSTPLLSSRARARRQ